MMMKVELTEELMGRVDRFAEKRARDFLKTFRRFVSDIKQTDFTQQDPKSRYEVRDKITELADKYDIMWDKFDVDECRWHCEGGFQFNKDCIGYYSLGVGLDYYDVKTCDLAKYIPEHIIREFEAMTLEQLKEDVKESILKYTDDSWMME